jgi:acyl-CoA oxidase
VDAFGYEPEHLRATIATGVEAERQAEARAYYAALRASGNAPVDEKTLTTKAPKAKGAVAKKSTPSKSARTTGRGSAAKAARSR